MYYITTKANVLPFALLGQHPNRAQARQMAKDLGGTCRTQTEYDDLVSPPMDAVTFEEIQETGDLEDRLEAALAVADQSTKPQVSHESSIERPCKQVWFIADELKISRPDAKRAEILAECVKRGIAYFTARTQYQQWLTIQKEMAAREAQQKPTAAK